MLTLLGNIFAQNFLPLLLLFCLLFLMLVDKSVARGTRKSLYSVLGIIFLLVLCDFFDVGTSVETASLVAYINSFERIPFWVVRNVASGLGYALRPLLLYFAIVILFRPKRMVCVLMSVPAVVNFVCSFLSIWTKWVYSIDTGNQWHEGPLRLLYFGVVCFYLVGIIAMLGIFWKRLSMRERIGIIFVLTAIVVSSYLDVIVGGYRTLILAIPAAFFMYYLCIYTQKSSAIIDEQVKQLNEQKTELLLAKLQPTFVHATLQSMYDLCARDPVGTREMIKDFSLYMRGNLDNVSSDIVSIEEEVEHTEYFINIMQQRFPKIKFSMDFSDTDFNVPFMILQPLIENAVVHGVRNLDNGKITCSIFKELDKNKRLVHTIRITDNGNGQNIPNPFSSQNTNLRVEAVRTRVQDLIGAQFEIGRVENVGTVVNIRVPAQSLV